MPAAWPPVDADAAMRKATFRLVTPAGGFAGTGFLVSGEGLLITCHHVAAPHAALRAIDQAGQSWDATPESLDDPILAAADIAIVRLAAAPAATPLPLVQREPGETFTSRVQLADAQAFRDSTPLAGELMGPSGITYRHNGREYRVDGRAVRHAHVLPGMSGAAVWDEEAAAVVGVLAVSAARDPNLGGFAIPFVGAASSDRLSRLLAANDATIPRYGDQPNRLGLQAIAAAGTAATCRRLRDRGLLWEAGFVPRERFNAQLGAFLAGSAPALAVVSAAGHGKTNLLAHVAQTAAERPVWLARATDLAADEQPEAALQRMLEEAGASGVSWPIAAGGMQPAPLLLLDGLNEAPIERRRLVREWMPELIAQAAGAGWRLVYTTRRELFELLRPALGSRQETFELGRYTQQEAEAAAAAYGVALRRGVRIEREPLLLRLRAEIGAEAHRAGLLRLFVERLLADAADGLAGLHPQSLIDELAKLAARKDQNGSGVADYTDPFFQARDVVQALCDANLLEMVPAGYRFVFDEVADYLHARHVATATIEADALAALPPHARATVYALALEILLEQDKGELARRASLQLAEAVAGSGPSRFVSFAALSALSASAIFAGAKRRAGELAAEDDGFVETLLAQPEVLAGLPGAALTPIARAALLLESGYGWREKDVSSEFHRHGTVAEARSAYGLPRVIDTLLDDPDVDGVAMLIGWLSDQTRLAEGRRKNASSEATVATFALCMLFAHRHRIGLQRLFEEVLLAERGGWISLLQGLAEEDTEAFAVWLEGLEPAALAARLGWTLRVWGMAIHNLDAHGGAGAARGAVALAALVPHVDDEGLGHVLDSVIGRGLVIPDLAGLARRLAGAGRLRPYTVAVAIRRGLLALPDALKLVGDNGRSEVIWNLAGLWELGEAQPPLAEIVALLWGERSWSRPDGFNMDLERLLRRVDLATAEVSGLRTLVETQLTDNLSLVNALAYVAFDWNGPAPGTEDFRVWLAERIAPYLEDRRLVVALSDLMRMSPQDLARYGRIAIDLAASAGADAFATACLSCTNAHRENVWLLAEACLDRIGEANDPDAAFVAALAARLREPEADEKHVFYVAHELADAIYPPAAEQPEPQ